MAINIENKEEYIESTVVQEESTATESTGEVVKSKVKKEKVKKEKVKKEEVVKEKADKFSIGNFISEMDSKVEGYAFGSVASKLKIVAKITLYVFAVFAIFALVLTLMLTSSLGALGVFVALFLIAVFLFVGYTISTLVYGFADVIENSSKPKSNFEGVVYQAPIKSSEVQSSVEEEIDSEFPEF